MARLDLHDWRTPAPNEELQQPLLQLHIPLELSETHGFRVSISGASAIELIRRVRPALATPLAAFAKDYALICATSCALSESIAGLPERFHDLVIQLDARLTSTVTHQDLTPVDHQREILDALQRIFPAAYLAEQQRRARWVGVPVTFVDGALHIPVDFGQVIVPFDSMALVYAEFGDYLDAVTSAHLAAMPSDLAEYACFANSFTLQPVCEMTDADVQLWWRRLNNLL